MTQTENYNRENVLKALADIVDEYGADHVYERSRTQCRYSNEDGTPSCIVGLIIFRVAPKMFARIHEWEYAGGEFMSCEFIQLGNKGLELDADTEKETVHLIEALNAGQYDQDRGKTWGEVEDHIRAMLGEGPRHGEA